MSRVVVVATFRLREGREEDALQGLRELAEQTHAEEGCLSYALHRGVEDPRTVVLVERWAARDALDAHFLKPYVAAVGARAQELLDGAPSIVVLEPLPAGDPAKGTL